MRKLLLLLIITSFVISCTSHAYDGQAIGVIEAVPLPETYVSPDSVELFSTTKPLEDVLVEGWTDLSRSIHVSDYNFYAQNDEYMAYVYRGVLLEHPEFFYVLSKIYYYYDPDTGKIFSISPVYTETDKSVINQTLAEIDAATEEVLLTVDESMTDFEKVMAVHDYMVLRYSYDVDEVIYDLTIMTEGVGVCQSYALAFKHLMNKLGIECQYVSARESMNHAWNLVKLDGEWYHIDLTWDDPDVTSGQARHTYALLSDSEISRLDHFGYDTRGLTADSTKYDNAPWHSGVGSIITIDGTCYWMSGNNFVDENNNVIFSNLDGGDGRWAAGGTLYFPTDKFAGLAEYNKILYFNSDKAIYSYDPETSRTTKILNYDGLCGLFVDHNTLSYTKYDPAKKTFTKAGEIKLGDIRYGGTNHENGKLVKRVYKENSTPLHVYSSGTNRIEMQKVDTAGFTKIVFDEQPQQTLFFWDKNMKPVLEKEFHSR